MLQPENGIYIKSWYEDPNDKALKDLSVILKDIIKSGVSDIRVALRDFRKRISKNSLKTVN